MKPIAFLNNNDGTGLLALGEERRFILSNESSDLAGMQHFIDSNAGAYIFMGLSYDLKEITLNAPSQNQDLMGVPLAFLWVPEIVVQTENDTISSILQGSLNSEYEEAIRDVFASKTDPISWDHQFEARTSKESYEKTFDQLIDHLQFGNIYEVNYCQEFYADSVNLENPAAAYFRLNAITQAPFSAYFSFDNLHILCGSPERYLERKGNLLRSQPIKGTSKRGQSEAEDLALKNQLLANPKERSENVMIVDLVRNDLSKIALKASVEVEELFGVYTFNTVHQLISTVRCEVAPEVSFTDILQATFPMGSMTGAPKKSAVEIIESHENFRRGLYSGSLGYLAPNGDFDLNVVIRSMIYNSDTKYLSCPVGGAITIQAEAAAEYEECNVKVKTILDRMHEEA